MASSYRLGVSIRSRTLFPAVGLASEASTKSPRPRLRWVRRGVPSCSCGPTNPAYAPLARRARVCGMATSQCRLTQIPARLTGPGPDAVVHLAGLVDAAARTATSRIRDQQHDGSHDC